MEFECLDIESEKLLEELLADEIVLNKNVRGTAIEYLVKHNYIDGILAVTSEDTDPLYVVTRITQKGKCYFEQKKIYKKESRKMSRREWIIAIISAIIGGIIGQMPTILQLMGVI